MNQYHLIGLDELNFENISLKRRKNIRRRQQERRNEYNSNRQSRRSDTNLSWGANEIKRIFNNSRRNLGISTSHDCTESVVVITAIKSILRGKAAETNNQENRTSWINIKAVLPYKTGCL